MSGRFSESTEYSPKITRATVKMRSPLLNSMPASVVTSPRSRMTITPANESTIPQACANVRRTPSRTSDHTATNRGPADCSNSVLSAWVCSSAQYCRVLNAPMPVIERTIMTPRRARIAPQSRIRCFQASGRMIRNASDQRRNDKVTGGICPAARRPTTALPAQHRAVIVSNTYGWLTSQWAWPAAAPEVRSEADTGLSIRLKQAVAPLDKQSSWHDPAHSQTRIFTGYQCRKMHRDHAMDLNRAGAAATSKPPGQERHPGSRASELLRIKPPWWFRARARW